MSKPMQEPTFLILTSLLRGPQHGYAILGDVAELSGSTLRIGTLYAALDRLAGDGLVVVDGEEVVNGRMRRTYSLTGRGETALGDETSRLERRARQARRRLAGRPAPTARTAVVR